MFVGWVIGRLEFTVTHTDYTVDARPIVQTVSRAGSDAVVLTFIVIARTVSTIFFGVGEGTDYTQRVVVLLVTILQVETAHFIRYALRVALSVTTGNSRSSSYCSTCGKSQNSGQC
ncbi:Uncharacterised protein [Salmonella enterica subsp. enterica serovar Typhi]|nr:Uncharacterised protein [Salmonella enterica subsp. enterica serovar Typhi]CHU35418.1 Uncharacterised protein [Salmonella enterica subsp. enterica serovar Typhi]